MGFNYDLYTFTLCMPTLAYSHFSSESFLLLLILPDFNFIALQFFYFSLLCFTSGSLWT